MKEAKIKKIEPRPSFEGVIPTPLEHFLGTRLLPTLYFYTEYAYSSELGWITRFQIPHEARQSLYLSNDTKNIVLF